MRWGRLGLGGMFVLRRRIGGEFLARIVGIARRVLAVGLALTRLATPTTAAATTTTTASIAITLTIA